MARKERNSVDYFPHSVTHGRKMFYLRSKFGNDGYAVWFMLLEQLGKSEYHYLDLKDKIQLMYLSSEFMVTEIVLKEIISILVDFEEFDKELWDEQSILYNEKFIENVSDAYKKRNNECIDKKSLLSLLSSKGRSLSPKSIPKLPKSKSEVPDNTQSIVYYTKEDESKENKSKLNQKTLLSEIKISDLESSEIIYFEIAFAYQKLFIKNLKEKNAPTTNQEKATYKNYVNPIRLMMQNDGVTKDQLTKVYKFLGSIEGEFWKSNILSTSKLREKFQQLLLKSQENGKPSVAQGAKIPVRSNLASYFNNDQQAKTSDSKGEFFEDTEHTVVE